MPFEDVMIVDDDLSMTMFLDELLKENGFNVVAVAHTGEEALIQARKTEPKLVLMDIKLGSGMDGIETAQALRKELGVACIFLTGFDDPPLLERAKKCWPLGCVLKPIMNGSS